MTILISTPTDLDAVRNNLTGEYELTTDIDMSSFGNFTPIGNSSSRFAGTFDGKGYKINNLTINQSTTYVGLFGYTKNATIQNLAIENASVTSNMQNYVSILAGAIVTSTITNCYTDGQVEGQYGVGGLVGWEYSGNVEKSYSKANATGKGRVGGLVGYGATSDSLINNCYSTGLVTVTPDPSVYNGGLVGSHVDSSKVTNSYWDTETSGQTTSAGGIGLTTTEMQTQSSYDNWDFTNVWGIDSDYPYLQVFGLPSPAGTFEERQVLSYVNNIYTSTQTNISVLRSVVSDTPPIFSDIDTQKSKSINTNSYILPIVSDISTENKTNKIINVQSFVNPIKSNISTQATSSKVIKSYILPINSKVITPNIILPIATANCWYEENLTNITALENKSNIYSVENPSYCEVI